MSKFNINKTLDVNKLSNNIAMFHQSKNIAPYIFMSKDTMDELSACLTEHVLVDDCVILSRYNGYKVFLDPDLEYGEVELR